MTVERLRKDIDAIDAQLVRLLNERARLAQQVGAIKGKGQKYRPAREAQVIRRVQQANDGPFRADSLTMIYREIIACCLALEQPLKIGYLGPAGTYSEEAARTRFGVAAQLEPCDALEEVFGMAEKQKVDLAVVPVENSTEGAVNRTLDLLLQSPLKIVGELELAIHHQLLSRETDLRKIASVAAHPQALAQCRNWLQRHLPHAAQVETGSNAQAARLAAKSSGMAAIAGKLASREYGLPILKANIEDDSANTTRFLVLGNQSVPASGNDKTSIVCSVPNRPGSLGEAMTIVAEAGVNLTKLSSRPSSTGLWDYIFYIDLDGHQDDRLVAQALAGLKRQASFVKILGSYPKDVQ